MRLCPVFTDPVTFIEAIKTCFVAHVLYPMYFNGKYLNIRIMQTSQVFALQFTYYTLSLKHNTVVPKYWAVVVNT